MWPDLHVWHIVAGLQQCYCLKYLRCAYLFWLSYADENGLYVYKVLSPGFLNFPALIFFLESSGCKCEFSSDYQKPFDLISLLWLYLTILFTRVHNTEGSRVVKKIDKKRKKFPRHNLPQWLNTDILRNYNPFFGLRWRNLSASFSTGTGCHEVLWTCMLDCMNLLYFWFVNMKCISDKACIVVSVHAQMDGLSFYRSYLYILADESCRFLSNPDAGEYVKASAFQPEIAAALMNLCYMSSSWVGTQLHFPLPLFRLFLWASRMISHLWCPQPPFCLILRLQI
jgi:hypothetical protein